MSLNWSGASSPTLLTFTVLALGCCPSDPAYLRSPDPEERREALTCLARDAREDSDAALRAQVVAAAVAMLGPTQAEVLSKAEVVTAAQLEETLARRDPGESVSEAVVRLGFADAATVARALEASEANEPSPAVRAAAARVLSYLGVSAEAARLGEHLGRDQHPIVRHQMAAALGELGGPSASEPLRQALARDSHAGVRLAAARELSRFQDAGQPGLQALIAALSDSNMEVRLNARRSLRVLTQQSLGLEPLPWARWLETAELPEDGDQPEDGGQPADDDLQPADDDLQPADDDLQPADDDLQPADDVLQPADDDLQPADDDQPAGPDVPDAGRGEDAPSGRRPQVDGP